MGRLEDAIADYSRAIKLDAKQASTYNSRGLALDRAGRRQEALADFTTAMELEANNPVYWHNRGFAYRNM